MFNITTVSALVLTAGMTMTANVQTEEVSVEQFVSHLVAQSTAATMHALQNELQTTILTASNLFDIEEQSMYAGKVEITDLPSEEEVNETDLSSELEAQKHVE